MTVFTLRRHTRGLGLSPRRSRVAGAPPVADNEAPSIPQNLSATAVSSSQIDLTWDASTDNIAVTGYNIYRDNVLIDMSLATSYSDVGLAPATTYEYEVSARDAAANESARSAPDSATTQSGADTEAPSVPQNLSAMAVSSSQIDLTWDASTDNVAVTGYNIYRDNLLIDTSPTNAYADTGLDPGTEYQYEVSAFDAAANESARSAPDSATTHYVATPVNFNGSTYLTRGGALTGVSDSKVWSGSMWFRWDGPEFTKLFTTPSAVTELLIAPGSNALVVFGKDTSGNVDLQIFVSDLPNDNEWHHIMWSVNMANAGQRWIYLDDVVPSVSWTTYNDDTLDFTGTDFHIGVAEDGSSFKYEGDLADVWLRFGGAVIDLGIEANRRLFVAADGKPASPAGWPSGGQIQLHGSLGSWHANKGSGGGFTVAAGALGAGSGPVELP